MREWLQLARAHTVPLEAVPAFIGAYLAVGEITPAVLLWLLFGALYHISGYAMNSYIDWRKGYDKDDPHKQHHPLNTGNIHPPHASIFSISLVIITVIVAISLIQYYSVSPFRKMLSFGVIFSGVGAGVFYNMYGKSTILKPVPITISHSSVFVVPYITLGGEINSIFISLVLLMLLWVIQQIGIYGEILGYSADNGEENIVKSISSKTHRRYTLINILSLQLIALFMAISATTLWFYGNMEIGLYTIPIFSMWLVADKHITIKSDRGTNQTSIGIAEGCKSIIFTAISLGSVAPILSIVVIASSVFYVMFMNSLLWGTLVAPKV